MRITILFTLTILLMTKTSCMQTEAVKSQTAFYNDEFYIEFNERILIKDSGQMAHKTNYFKQTLTIVKFCKFRQQPSHIQQAGPDEDGYLCKMYILPFAGIKKITQEYRQLTAAKKHYERFIGFKHQEINGRKVTSWRYQLGKTRLDHFLIFGTKHKYNYLFISSPYGSNGRIEDIIKKIKVR